jgi:hypothetical protein
MSCSGHSAGLCGEVGVWLVLGETGGWVKVPVAGEGGKVRLRVLGHPTPLCMGLQRRSPPATQRPSSICCMICCLSLLWGPLARAGLGALLAAQCKSLEQHNRGWLWSFGAWAYLAGACTGPYGTRLPHHMHFIFLCQPWHSALSLSLSLFFRPFILNATLVHGSSTGA